MDMEYHGDSNRPAYMSKYFGFPHVFIKLLNDVKYPIQPLKKKNNHIKQQ